MIRRAAALALALLPATLAAQTAPRAAPPKLIVAISVDQFSADLFAEYRQHWVAGMKRLSEGVVFPSGYQSHAATETCPGHSTILTGDRPARTGIIANSWINQNAARADKTIYCAEDETRAASSKSGVYIPSPIHLKVPTLGDRMKDANPATRVVAVAGKDRAAIMMGGHKTDQIWFLRPTDYVKFETLSDHTGPVPAAVTRANAAIDAALTRPVKPMALTPMCETRARSIPLAGGKSVGDGRFGRPARPDKTAERLFRASPESDAVTLSLAGDLIAEMKLGQQAQTDLIAIGVSATDVVGHSYGTEGSEMCLQLTALDAALGTFFARLDKLGIDYAVVLTADHGGHDLVERNDEHAIPDAQRIRADLTPGKIGEQVARDLGLTGNMLVGAEPSGDVWIDKAVPADKRAAVLARAIQLYKGDPQVETALSGAELATAPLATLPPEAWSLAERARASYDKDRSGDLVVLLKPRVTPITRDQTALGYVATHGSPWNYDRRVPIVFWRKGITPFEQPNGIETVDIAPSLAGLIGLAVPAGDMDGVCRDLDAGAGSTCP